MSLRSAVFLDRDGVLNRALVVDGVPHPPASVDQLEILPGVAAAMQRLIDLGYILIGVTNQPDVARGTQTHKMVEAINAELRVQLPLHALYVCYHDNADHCDCRKPKPGMLLRAAAEHRIALSSSFMVGDRHSDILAGAAAGCRTLLIARPYSKAGQCCPDYEVADLEMAAQRIGLMRDADCRNARLPGS